MSLREAEKRRTRSQAPGSDDERVGNDRDGVPNGVFLVAAFAFLGGAIDLFIGFLSLRTPFLVFGLLVALLGGLKCWAAIGLFRLQARGAGLVILLYGTGALIDGVWLTIAVGSDASPGEPAARILFALVVIGYLLFRIDHFE